MSIKAFIGEHSVDECYIFYKNVHPIRINYNSEKKIDINIGEGEKQFDSTMESFLRLKKLFKGELNLHSCAYVEEGILNIIMGWANSGKTRALLRAAVSKKQIFSDEYLIFKEGQIERQRDYITLMYYDLSDALRHFQIGTLQKLQLKMFKRLGTLSRRVACKIGFPRSHITEPVSKSNDRITGIRFYKVYTTLSAIVTKSISRTELAGCIAKIIIAEDRRAIELMELWFYYNNPNVKIEDILERQIEEILVHVESKFP